MIRVDDQLDLFAPKPDGSRRPKLPPPAATEEEREEVRREILRMLDEVSGLDEPTWRSWEEFFGFFDALTMLTHRLPAEERRRWDAERISPIWHWFLKWNDTPDPARQAAEATPEPPAPDLKPKSRRKKA